MLYAVDWTATGTLIIAGASVVGLIMTAFTARSTARSLETLGGHMQSLGDAQRDTARALEEQARIASDLQQREIARARAAARPIINKLEHYLYQLPTDGVGPVLGILPSISSADVSLLADLATAIGREEGRELMDEFRGHCEAIQATVARGITTVDGTAKIDTYDLVAWSTLIDAARATLHRLRYEVIGVHHPTPLSSDARRDIPQVLISTQEILNDPRRKLPGYGRFEVFLDESGQVCVRGIRSDGTERFALHREIDWKSDVSAVSPQFFARSLEAMLREADERNVPAGWVNDHDIGGQREP